MNRLSIRIVLYAAAIMLAMTGHAQASAFGLFTSASVDDGKQSPTAAVGGFSLTGDQVVANLTSSFFGVNSFVGSASADASFGQLQAFASVDLTNYQGVNFSAPNIDPATASANFHDHLTFTGGSGNAFLRFQFDVDGSTSFSGDLAVPLTAQNQSIVTVRTGSTATPFGGGVICPGCSQGFTGDATFLTPGLQFTYGTPFEFTVSLQAFVRILDSAFSSGFVYDQRLEADFDSTIVLTAIQVFSDAGLTNQVSTFSLQSQSGTTYPTAAPAPVPEPGTLLLLATGLAAVAARRYRRRA